jgi:hypothetical protein
MAGFDALINGPNYSQPYRQVATPAATAARQAGLANQNFGPDDWSNAAAAAALGAAGRPTTPANIHDYRVGNINAIAAGQSAAARRPSGGSTMRLSSSGSGGSGGSGGRISYSSGGRGGGGGTPAPTLQQGQLDWITNLLRGGAPDPMVATRLDLPDYGGMAVRAFDPSMFRMAMTALQQGQQTDLGTARQSTSDMLNFLQTNYRNAFNNPNLQYAQAGQAPGMDQQAMNRMLQAQGVDPSVASATQMQGGEADRAFGNLWRTLGANEDIMQRSRVGNAQQYGNQAVNAINAAAAGGRLGINLNQAQAQAAWQQRADERAYQDYQIQQQLAQQEALQSWQRANQVQDTNFQTGNEYRNTSLSALLGLLPEFIRNAGLRLPTPEALGWG